MKKIGEFSGLKLMEVATGGDIRFNKVDMNYGENGFTLLPTSDNDPLAGDVWINNLYNSESQGGNAPQSYGYLTILHEIGHALGLKHPFEDYPVLPRDRDNTNYTIMSYTQKNSVTLDFITDDYSYKCKTDVNAMPSNYQMYDMEAIIATYGANLEYHKEDDIYKLSQLYENHQYLTIWDAGGEDTIDISEVTHASAISLNSDYLSSIDFHSIAEQEDKTVAELGAENDPDMVSWIHDAYNNPQCSQGNGIYTGEGNLAIAKGAIIENLISGSGNDSIIDNSASNKIYAGAGDDQIYLSYGGYDIVDGGEGVDTVFIQKAHAEIALEKNLYGNVFIFDSQSDEIIAELSGIEKIHLTDEVLDIT
jgi:Ca2+-binding RTX toxin-like protein